MITPDTGAAGPADEGQGSPEVTEPGDTHQTEVGQRQRATAATGGTVAGASPGHGSPERIAGVTVGPEPAWLSAWRSGPVGTADALSRFDGLFGIEGTEMLGRWRGESLPTGHPLDGLLEALSWHGKTFEGPDQVQPLLFRRSSGHLVSLDPALMPVRIALTWPTLARSRVVRAAFDALLPVLRTGGSAARLRACDFRGRRSAAMIYASQPITDHFRRIDANRVIGLMEGSGMERPFFFLLTRDAGG